MDDRQGVWPLYGWFSGLICIGSLFGIVSAGTYMHAQTFFYTLPDIYSKIDAIKDANDPVALVTRVSMMINLSATAVQFNHSIAAFFIAYVIEFNCACLAKLIVLDRLVDFGARQVNVLTRYLYVLGRIVIATVFICNMAGLSSNIAAAVLSIQASNLNLQGSIVLNDILLNYNPDTVDQQVDSFLSFYLQAEDKFKNAAIASSVQSAAEVFVSFLIIASFLVIGIYSVRRVNISLRSSNVGASGRQLRIQIVVTIVCLFVTLLLRSVLSVFYALADAHFRPYQSPSSSIDSFNCSRFNTFCDQNCNSEYAMMKTWYDFTPQFIMSIFLITSPLALLVALWGMTSRRMRRCMQQSNWGVSVAATSLLLAPHQ